MNSLAVITLVLGVLILGGHLALGLAPQPAGTWLAGFPRNKWAGRILTVLAVAWVAWLVWHTPMAWLEQYRLPLCAFSPVACALIIIFVDELLAVRALGGIFLLLPASILDAAFVYPSADRLVMTVFAYILAVLGMILVWSPYMFRKMTLPWIGKPAVCRVVGAAGSALGLVMILLGWLIYR